MEFKKRGKFGMTDLIAIINWQDKYCKDFDPKVSYRKSKKTEKLIKSYNGQSQIVGKAYRLVEDMMDKKATKKELQRAVRYLMVCVYGYEYQLDYWKAHSDFGIRELSNKYSRNYMVV